MTVPVYNTFVRTWRHQKDDIGSLQTLKDLPYLNRTQRKKNTPSQKKLKTDLIGNVNPEIRDQNLKTFCVIKIFTIEEKRKDGLWLGFRLT